MSIERNRFGPRGWSRVGMGERIERLLLASGTRAVGAMDRLEERTLLDATGWGLAPTSLPADRGGFGAQFADFDGDNDLDLIEVAHRGVTSTTTGISVEAAQPVVAGLSHFDALQPGGWASLGTPMAGIVNL